MKLRACVKYCVVYVSYCLCKHSFPFNLTQTALNLTTAAIFITRRLFAQFYLKFKAFKLQKMLKVAFLANCFTDLFTEVKT